jgi:predicted acyltransferase
MRKFQDRISWTAVKKILTRAALIFLVGVALNIFPFKTPLSNLRILGVLQRIGIAYGIAALLYLCFSHTKLLFISGIILIGYWLLMLGFGRGDPYAVETNLVLIIDLKILGENHLWKGLGIPFDPEGLLSTLPSVATVILGALTGKSIQSAPKLKSAVQKLFFVGISAIVLGKIWDLIFPINKYIWTSSYVLFTAGLAMVILALLLWLIDVKGYRKWAFPFVVFGMNPLFLYILSSIWVRSYIHFIHITEPDGSVVNGYKWIYNHLFVPLAGNMNGSLLFAITHVFVFWIILFILYKKRIFIKI